MGFFQFINKKMARGPAIIGTIETIANLYIKLLDQDPDKDKKEIFQQIVEIRYSILPLENELKYYKLLVKTYSISNLTELIYNILCAETELDESSDNFKKEVWLVIDEELEKKYKIK